MRKTSQDGGDTTSITSGVENEIKKPSAGIIKSKRNSIKRKVQTLSHESDDAVIEPLLQKEKEKPETTIQSAKFSVMKSKAETVIERDSDKDKLLPDSKIKTSVLQDVSLSSSGKENISFKTQPNTIVTLHNHMNTNVFNNIETTKFINSTKSQILVEIDGCKQVGYSPSPLIFTTAKIHTDSKTKQMEPVQVTTVPILSTAEIANAGKINNMNILKAVPSTSEVKITEKPFKNINVASPSIVADTSRKYTTSTASENRVQNTLSDRGSLVSSSITKDSTKPGVFTADVQVCKSIPSKVEPTASISQAESTVSQSLKKDIFSKTSQPQSMHSTDNKSSTIGQVSKAYITSSDSTPGGSNKSKTEEGLFKLDKSAVLKKDTLKQQDGKIDENANKNFTVQQPIADVTGIKKSPVDANIYTDNSSKDKTVKDPSSSSSIKLLPRQKNVVVEEAGDIISKSKPPFSENTNSSNIPKLSKNTEGKASAPGKSTVPSQVTERDVSDKTLPKSSANNIIDTMTTKITATSKVSKPTVSLSSAIKSPVVSKPQSVITTSVSTTAKPIATKIPSIDTKTKSSITPTLTSSTISNKPQTLSSTVPSTTPSTVNNKVSTVSTIKSSDTGGVAQSSAPNKLNGASTSKSVSGIVASTLSFEKTSPATSNGSSPLSITIKPSQVKTVSTSGGTSTTTAKPTSAITPAVKSSASNKKNGPKTNEVNKDNKGLKT